MTLNCLSLNFYLFIPCKLTPQLNPILIYLNVSTLQSVQQIVLACMSWIPSVFTESFKLLACGLVTNATFQLVVVSWSLTNVNPCY
jgi:hypothetical protein